MRTVVKGSHLTGVVWELGRVCVTVFERRPADFN